MTMKKQKLILVCLMTGRTGYDTIEDTYVTTTEIIDLGDENVQCDSWSDYNIPLGNANAGFLGTFPIFCGGNKFGNRTNDCYKASNSVYEYFGSMISNRSLAASLVTLDNKLWITGGLNNPQVASSVPQVLKSSDLISDDGTIRQVALW